jgi:hypothetical protein
MNMNKSQNIITREEAMRLPVQERPLCYRISEEIYMAVWDAVGQATQCYNNPPPDSELLPEKVSKLVVTLCFKIAEELEKVRAEASNENWTVPAEPGW